MNRLGSTSQSAPKADAQWESGLEMAQFAAIDWWGLREGEAGIVTIGLRWSF